jgi:hypothetical protein
MKHAFIFGTSIFLSNHRTLSYSDGDTNTTFVTIRSFLNHQNSPNSALVIDADIDTIDDHHPVRVTNNMVQQGNDIRIEAEPNRVRLYHTNHAEPLLDVYQLDAHEYEGLSSHILNEIHSQHPDPVFTIKGNFKVAGAHIEIQNEKMFIDADSIANGVNNAHDGVILMGEKVH